MIDPKVIDPKRTALLVIDKQAGYFDQAFVKKRNKSLPKNSSEVLSSIDEFIKLTRKLKIPVIWTKMVEDPTLSPEPIRSLMPPESSIAKPGEPSFEIFGLQPKDSETIIVKPHYNAFASTGLAKLLKDMDVKTVVLVGGYATRCVLATIVGASDSGLICVVPRGLVINQVETHEKVDALYSIVDVIFGYSPRPEEIISIWQSFK